MNKKTSRNEKQVAQNLPKRDEKKNDNIDSIVDIFGDIQPKKDIKYLINLPNTNRPFTVSKEQLALEDDILCTYKKIQADDQVAV